MAASLCTTGLLPGCASPNTEDRPLVVAVDSRPRVFDPRLATSDIDGRVTRLTFAGLVTVDTPDARPAPALAERVERVDDHTVIASMRAGLRFHNGSVLNADDVICTVESVQSESLGSPYRSDWLEITVERLNEQQLRFRSADPDPSLELRLELGILPCEAVAAGQSIDGAFDGGSGPWRLDGQRDDGSILLRSNPTWWAGEPAVDTVLLRPVADPNTRLMGLLGGTIDIVANGVPPMLLPTVEANPDIAVARGPALRYTYLVFQLDRDVFADVRARRAAALAIDRAALVEHRFGGAAELSSGMLPPTHWAYQPGEQTAYDPAAARALLAEAFPTAADGCVVRGTLSSSSNRLYRGVASVITEQLAAVGICLEQRSYEWATFFADVKAGDFDVALLQWTSIVDPGHYAWAFHSRNVPTATNRSAGGNRGRWRDAEVDAWLDEAGRTTHAADRAALYGRVQRRANEVLPYVSLWHEENIVAYRRELSGVQVIPTGRLAWLAQISRSTSED